MSDRGMKKWAPFSALHGQYEEINRLKEIRDYKSKPQISIEQAEKINRILSNYNNEELEITYYKKGRKIIIQGKIIQIDILNKVLFLQDRSINISDLLDIEDSNTFIFD